MGKIIAVVSGKGGTGKTTTVAAISSCLAALGYKTLCIDFGAQMGNLDFSLCMYDYKPTEIREVLGGQIDIAEAAQEHPIIKDLSFLSVPPSFDPGEFSTGDIKPFFAEIRDEFDYCLIDSPPVTSASSKLALADADTAILVTTGELPAIGNASRAASLVRRMGVKDLRLLLNRVQPKNLKLLRTSVDAIIDIVGIRLIGIIPEDELIFRALHTKSPLIMYNKRRSAYDFLDVARRLADDDVPLRIHFQNKIYGKRGDTAHRIRNNSAPPPIIVDIKDKDDMKSKDEPHGTLVGSYGNPELWVESTLAEYNDEDLVRIQTITPNNFTGKETIRQRMWLHDILDDHGIPYLVRIIGYWPSRRRFQEAQCIYVEEKNVNETNRLINEYKDPGSIMTGDSSIADAVGVIAKYDESEGKLPQKKCTACGREIDFDHRKCPHCKAKLA